MNPPAVRRPNAVATVLLAAIAAMLTTACQSKAPEMTPEETRRIADLTERMSPRCVGRYLIDLPERFVLNSESTTELEGVKARVAPMGRGEFDATLRQVDARMRQEKIYGEDRPSLLATHEIPGGHGQVFNRSATREIEQARTLELHGWKDGYRFELLLNATDMTRAKRIREGDTRRTDVQDKLTHLLKVYERIRGRKDTEVPSEQGVCFANGFLQGPATDAENVEFHHQWQDAPDVYFSYTVSSGIGPEDDTLLERGPAIEANLAKVNGKTLRHGARVSSGIPFDEWLMQRQSAHGVMIYDFTLEANSKHGNAAHPLLHVDLTSGLERPAPSSTSGAIPAERPPLKATLGPAESLALWDKVTATLRPRPGAF